MPRVERSASRVSTQTPKNPLISVVTVCLNAEDHVARAIESVLGQTYHNIEYIVVDGASADGTLAVVRKYEPAFEGRLRWISEPDEGLYDAMNKGVALATGDLIGILNADDYYELDALERVAEVARHHPSAGIVYGDDRTIAADGNTEVRPTPEFVTLDAMRWGHIVHHHAAFVAAWVYRAVGTYDTRHHITADYDFFLRCIETGVPFARAEGVLTNFSLLGVSYQSAWHTNREATRVRIDHGAQPAISWMRFYKGAAGAWLYRRLEHNPSFLRFYKRRTDRRVR